MKARDKSVRDLPQTAELKGGLIVVCSHFGRNKTGTYSITLQEWQKTYREFNPSWWQIELLRSKANLSGDGGLGQTDRILDSQRRAVIELLRVGEEG